MATKPTGRIASGALSGTPRFMRPVPTANEQNCIVKYTAWPTSGTAVTNTGSGGATYNAVCAINSFTSMPSGATAFVTNSSAQDVRTPHAALVDNLGRHTIEMEFFYNLPDSVATPIVFSKSASYLLGLVTSSFRLTLQRYDTGGTNYVQFVTPVNSFLPGRNHRVQIAWDATSVTNVPTICIDGFVQVLTPLPLGTVTAWKDDSGTSFYWCQNAIGGTLWLNSNLTLVRIHNVVFSPSMLKQNDDADKWRVGA